MTSRPIRSTGFLRIGLVGLSTWGFMASGCAGLSHRDQASDVNSAYFSKLPTGGSSLGSARRGSPMTPSVMSLDAASGWKGKMAKMVDDTVNHVAAPGFATMR